jgi:hypothetical protein
LPVRHFGVNMQVYFIHIVVYRHRRSRLRPIGRGASLAPLRRWRLQPLRRARRPVNGPVCTSTPLPDCLSCILAQDAILRKPAHGCCGGDFSAFLCPFLCPCALALATPTAIMAGIGNATRRGMLVSEGDALGRLAKVRRVAFDKTGTLTFGKPSVTRVESCDPRQVKRSCSRWRRAPSCAPSILWAGR